MVSISFSTLCFQSQKRSTVFVLFVFGMLCCFCSIVLFFVAVLLLLLLVLVVMVLVMLMLLLSLTQKNAKCFYIYHINIYFLIEINKYIWNTYDQQKYTPLNLHIWNQNYHLQHLLLHPFSVTDFFVFNFNIGCCCKFGK